MGLAMEALGIMGAWFAPLKVIPARGGPVLHFLKKSAGRAGLLPNGIGEIYFSEILPGKIKAWKLHERQNGLLAVPSGLVWAALYDTREGSPTKGALRAAFLGRPDHYGLLRVPAGVWHGFQCAGKIPALLCNCADMEHDPAEGRGLPWDDPSMPRCWLEN